VFTFGDVDKGSLVGMLNNCSLRKTPIYIGKKFESLKVRNVTKNLDSYFVKPTADAVSPSCS
jgi:hypothetical protein